MLMSHVWNIPVQKENTIAPVTWLSRLFRGFPTVQNRRQEKQKDNDNDKDKDKDNDKDNVKDKDIWRTPWKSDLVTQFDEDMTWPIKNKKVF